jgi:hypothetical protein
MTTLRTRRRCLRDLASLGCAGALGGCAAILHPERQGNSSGPIDVVPLILDILWFIPGLVPGIIAIAVDFGTGAIYLGGSRRAALGGPTPLAIVPGERITVRAPRTDEDVDVALRLVGPRDIVLHDAHGRWSPDERDDLRVVLAPERSEALGDGRLELVVRRRGLASTAVHPLVLRPAHA